MEPRRITVLGDGQMGLVMASVLADNTEIEEVRLWGHHGASVERIRQTRTSPRLKAFSLPERVRVLSDDAEAVSGSDTLLIAVPVQFIRPVLERLRGHVERSAAIASVSKGIESDTLLRPLQVAGAMLDGDPSCADRRTVVVSGPTIAAELARCLPATMIAASNDTDFATAMQRLLTTKWLRVYTGTDPMGVELAGASKNVIAIAAGVLDGLQAGYNAKSALLARGLAEIARLGAALGAERETFFGLAGVGDLATTCFSPEGRNRSCGEALGKGESLTSYLARTASVVEGVQTSIGVKDLAAHHNVDMPIARAVHAVLHEQLDPIDAIGELMRRELKEERVG